VRANVIEEILGTARSLLVAHGHHALTTRAVAREMGMSSPAVYRYFANHEALEDMLLVDLFGELTTHIREVAAGHTKPVDALIAASRALRAWASEHVREFEFMLVAPLSTRTMSEDQLRARREFGGAFLTLLKVATSADRPRPPRMSVAAKRAMQEFCAHCGVEMDANLAPTALQCWMRLYGSVCMTAMGQLDSLGPYADTLFEWELEELGRLLGH
jgi:AcrR family transcriptional regulator